MKYLYDDKQIKSGQEMKKIIITGALKPFIERDMSILARKENRIFYVNSGQEALDVHKREKGDLIIVQLESPDLPCEKLCTAIRGDEVLKGVSILIVCSEDTSDIERCLKYGANDYVTQPLNPAGFLRKVMRLLNISERTHYRVIVKVSGRDNGDEIPFFCTSQNISSSGILLETEKVLNRGDKITCSFFVPKNTRIVTKGEIMRIMEKENGIKEYGVRFIDISPSVESNIEAFIENWTKRRKRYR
jgi:DNA-binding response OmpR family regulator